MQRLLPICGFFFNIFTAVWCGNVIQPSSQLPPFEWIYMALSYIYHSPL